MAITCPRCGAGFDVTLFQFGHGVRCGCGEWVEAARGHVLFHDAQREGPAMSEQEIGRVSHYFGHIQVAAIEITQGSLRVGDTIHVKGHTTDFTQKIDSMQIDKKAVQEAVAGQSIGIKVADHAREHDVVYRVEE